jgi:cyclopropane fatty-acyl-phospholipid synthase-like methyltransferase
MNFKNKRNTLHDDHFKKMISLNKKKITLGSYSAFEWTDDPKHLIFSLSRYKFVSKMLKGKKNVLEIGAGDGFKSRIVSTEVGNLDLSDVTPSSMNQFEKSHIYNNNYFVHDFTKKKYKKKYDAIYSLDVIEHIEKKICDGFVKNIKNTLKDRGVLIFGCPSLSSQEYANEGSKKLHVNCFDKDQLDKYLSKFFKNVFTFGMNDEVVHTGFDKMCHYVFAICVK